MTFQARAWAGNYGTFEEALAGGNTSVGKGPLFELKTKDPANSLELTPNIWQAPGWQGFCIDPDFIGCIIPEPSTVALCLLGAASLIFLRLKR